MREIEISGIVNVNMSEEEFWDAFVDFVENNGGYFGGKIQDVTKED